MKTKVKKVSSKPTAKAKSRPVSRPAPKTKAAKPAAKPAAGRATPTVAESVNVGGVRIRPLRDRILVRRVEEKEKRLGGIIVPDSAKEKPQQAEVMAAGSGRVLENGERVPLSVKRGDLVLVGKWSGTEVKLQGEEYLILKEDEVLGILG